MDVEAKHLNALLQRAEKTELPADEAEARTELLAFINRYPDTFDRNANLASKVEQQLVEIMGGKAFGVLITMDLKLKRRELGYDQASALERILIDRLMACWLRVQQAELRKSSGESKGVSLHWALVWDKRLEIANKNFLRAIRTLALVRRKPVPKVLAQVNIGIPNSSRPESIHP